MMEQDAPLQPYNTKELATLYKMDSRTFKKWIKPYQKQIGRRKGNYYDILQVETIFTLRGWPKIKVLPPISRSPMPPQPAH